MPGTPSFEKHRPIYTPLIRLARGVVLMTGAGAPTSGTSGTGAKVAGKASLYFDATNGILYQNTGTISSPTWTPMAAGPGGGVLNIANKSGGDLAAGALVYISGYDATSGFLTVAKADADLTTPSGAQAEYLLRDAVANNATGLAYKTGTISAVNTNAGNVGDPVYLDTTAGGWVLVAPTGAGAVQQVVGFITVKSATVGAIQVDLENVGEVIGTTQLQAGAVTTAKLASQAVKFANALVFVSTEQTGTGSAQNVAHGLGAVPAKVLVVPTDLTPATVGSYVVTEGAHDGTNVVVTVTTNKKFKVMAWA